MLAKTSNKQNGELSSLQNLVLRYIAGYFYKVSLKDNLFVKDFFVQSILYDKPC